MRIFAEAVVLRTIPLAVAATLAAGCGRAEPKPCPEQLARVVEQDEPAEETFVLLDLSLSADSASPVFRAQVEAAVRRAVSDGTALRVVAFGGAASATQSLVACANVAPIVRVEDGRDTAVRRVTGTLTAAVRERVDDLKRPTGNARHVDQSGTDVLGAFHAVAQTDRFAPRRSVLALTDGVQHKAPVSAPPRLHATSVDVYGVGRFRNGGSLPTADAFARADALRAWLLRTGAHPVHVSTQTFDGGSR